MMIPILKINLIDDDEKIISKFVIKNGIVDFHRFDDKKIHVTFNFQELADLIVKSIEEEVAEEKVFESTYYTNGIELVDAEDDLVFVEA